MKDDQISIPQPGAQGTFTGQTGNTVANGTWQVTGSTTSQVELTCTLNGGAPFSAIGTPVGSSGVSNATATLDIGKNQSTFILSLSTTSANGPGTLIIGVGKAQVEYSILSKFISPM